MKPKEEKSNFSTPLLLLNTVLLLLMTVASEPGMKLINEFRTDRKKEAVAELCQEINAMAETHVVYSKAMFAVGYTTATRDHNWAIASGMKVSNKAFKKWWKSEEEKIDRQSNGRADEWAELNAKGIANIFVQALEHFKCWEHL